MAAELYLGIRILPVVCAVGNSKLRSEVCLALCVIPSASRGLVFWHRARVTSRASVRLISLAQLRPESKRRSHGDPDNVSGHLYRRAAEGSTHTITAAPTSVTVFVSYTHPLKTQQFNTPIELFSFTDYQRYFGGFFTNEYFDAEAALFGDVARAVNQFFLNGGAVAWVVGLQASNNQQLGNAASDLAQFTQLADLEQAGVYSFPTSPTYSYPGLTLTIGPLSFFPLELTDSNHQLRITITNCQNNASGGGDNTADIAITYAPPHSSPLAGTGGLAETYRQVSAFPFTGAGGTPSITPGKPNPNYILTRINGVSSLVNVVIDSAGAALQPTSNTALASFP